MVPSRRRGRPLRALSVVAVAFAVVASAHAAAADVPVEDVAAESGIDFVHAGFHAGDGRDGAAFYESTAGGACWGDFDADGRLDLFITDFLDHDFGGRSRLYRNLGGGFADVTDAVGIGAQGVGQGCAWGDFDNDGWRDLYVTFAVTDYSSQGNVLYRNVQGERFVDVTAEAGVGGDATDPDATEPCFPLVETPDGRTIGRCWSVGVAWLDFDLDGDLDLYVANYAEFPHGTCVHEFRGNPVSCRGQPNRLYRNDGDAGFVDVGRAAGVDVNGQPTRGRSLGVLATDLDGDGWPDIYVANDKDANALYLNNRDGTFRSVASAMGVDNFGPTAGGAAEHRAGMGVAAADFDDDGRVDLASTHLKAEFDAVYRNVGDGWRDVARDVGFGDAVALDESRWGVGFWDFDLDGRKDALVVAGDQARTTPGPVHLLLQRDGRFVWQGAPAWPFVAQESRANHRAAAFADFDDDGDVDVLVTALPSWHGVEARPKLLRFGYADASGTEARALRVVLEGTDGAREPVGAHVTVTTEDGRAQHRWRVSGGSYAGDDDPRLHFGLGNATRGTVDVRWPGGAASSTPFDVGDARVAEVRVVEPNLRPPPPVEWRGGAAVAAGEPLSLEWQQSRAADFAGYLVFQCARAGCDEADAVLHEVAPRDAPRLLTGDIAVGDVFRVLVVDAAGHRSLPSVDLVVSVADAPVPAPAPALVLIAAAVSAMAAGAARRVRDP